LVTLCFRACMLRIVVEIGLSARLCASFTDSEWHSQKVRSLYPQDEHRLTGKSTGDL
jgi:hypothetical protein